MKAFPTPNNVIEMYMRLSVTLRENTTSTEAALSPVATEVEIIKSSPVGVLL